MSELYLFRVVIKSQLYHLAHTALSTLGVEYQPRISTNVSSQTRNSKTDVPTVKSSATATAEPHITVLQPSHSNMSNLEVQSTCNSSLWGLPCLDKDTFYAAALYLYAAYGELEVKPLFRRVETPEATQNFLDRFADCFARSKLEDARDHVSATAMVRNTKDKVITIYIAKNQSEKGCQAFATQEELGDIANENEIFAKQLVDWFSTLASKDDTPQVNENDPDTDSETFKTMCRFSWSRLEHYISTISESSVDILDNVVLANLHKCCAGWEKAKSLINECKRYHDMKSRLPDSGNERICLLTAYARSAGRIRRHPDFCALTNEVETSLSDKRPKLEHLTQVVKWINHLGRLSAAFTSFQKFCKDEKQSGYSFRHQLLHSEEDDWAGDTYKNKIKSWTGDLDLNREREVRIHVGVRPVLKVKTVEELMNEVVGTGKKARVHCEMQLLVHFSKPGVEKCLDYFGCSKKSCWMCWQVISQNYKYSMKNTHRKLFPRWAFPFKFSISQPGIAEGLRAAYNEMLIMIQDQIIRQRPLTTLEPYPQTSARMTPAHLRSRIGDDLDHGPLSRCLSSNVITVPERFAAVRVPALYLPADDNSLETLQQVSVDAYERNDSDPAERYLMRVASFAGREVIFAFQLLTKPKPANFSDIVGEVQTSIWQWRAVPYSAGLYTSQTLEWHLYYRLLEDAPAPNPHIFQIRRKIYGEENQYFPWRGDLFIILLHRPSFYSRYEVLQEPYTLNRAHFFLSLNRYFESIKRRDVTGEYARREVEKGLESVSQDCELFNEAMTNRRDAYKTKEKTQSGLESRRVFMDDPLLEK